MSKIKVAIVGVGNCASSLVQGVEYYKDVDEKSGFVPGIAHNTIGHYRIRDIQFVAAFDVDKNKVGKDLSDAIFTSPNCAMKFSEVPNLGNVLNFVAYLEHQQFLPCPNVICDALSHAGCSSYVLLTLLRFYRQRRINPDQVVVALIHV